MEQRQAEALAAARSQARSELESVFSALYPPDLPEEDGMKTSRNERLSKGYQSIALTYGEVSATGVSFCVGVCFFNHGSSTYKRLLFAPSRMKNKRVFDNLASLRWTATREVSAVAAVESRQIGLVTRQREPPLPLERVIRGN